MSQPNSFDLSSRLGRALLSLALLVAALTTSAISVASETELSIDFVLRGQATHNFAVGHFGYLAQQLRDMAKQVADSTPERGLEPNMTSSRAQIDELSGALATVRSDTKNAESLKSAKKRVHAIRKALEHEKSAL